MDASKDLILKRQKKLNEFKLKEDAGTLGVPQSLPIILNGKPLTILYNGKVTNLITVQSGEKLWKPAADSLIKMLKALNDAGYGYDLVDTYRPIGSPGDGELYADRKIGATQYATYEIYKNALIAFLEGENNPSYKSDPFYIKYIKYINNGAAIPGTSYHGYGLAIDIYTKNHVQKVGTSKDYFKKDANGKTIEPKEPVQIQP